MKKKLLCGLVSLLLMLLPAGVAMAEGEGAVCTISENGFTLTMTTDKTEYLAGEEIHYTITLENNREFWVLEKTDISYRNSDGLIAASEGSMPESFPQIEAGEKYVLEGVLIGDATVFPPEITTTPAGTEGTAQEGTQTPDADVTKAPVQNPDENETPSQGTPIRLGGILTIVAAVIVVAVVLVIMFKKKGGGTGKKLMAFFLIAGLTIGSLSGTSVFAASLLKTYDKWQVRPYVTVQYGGQEVTIRITARIGMAQVKQGFTLKEYEGAKRTTCHDPSIFKDFDGTYYIFGTHMALSKTENLKDWTNMDATYRASYSQDVIKQIRAWNKDENSGAWYDNLWAPDIIYNEAMGKYCMYLSANGDTWKSNIVLLTADKVTGPYEYAGSLVYSGFEEDTWEQTDFGQVTGETSLPERYITHGIANGQWKEMWPNCIDPCVFYDDEGNLWMSYGSWFGGIFMLELDEQTGLRDYNVKYETNEHSDAYYGTKIAGGHTVSGEASYIEKIGDYYWLFISYGGLESTGGYNVRVFRSKTPNGGYVDALGNDAFSDHSVNNINMANKGVRLFGGYQWRTMGFGEVAQGHNSAFVDDDGKVYIVYHTRTTDGSEGHTVRVHQMFLNKEGWLVAAPYQMAGETLDTAGCDAADFAGKYEVILHELALENYKLDVNRPEAVYLNADGTVTGYYEGTWALEKGTPYITLTLDGVTYSGIAMKQKVESLHTEAYVFTALGKENQLTIWGSKSLEQ